MGWRFRGAELDVSVVSIGAKVESLLLRVIIIIAALASRATGAVHVGGGLVEDHHVSLCPDVLTEPHGLVAALPLRPPLLSQDRPHG